MNIKNYLFGSFTLNPSQIFFESKLCIGIVNIKPIVPGHVLVLPKRVESRLLNLTHEEYSDLFDSVKKISSVVESHYKADALNIALQDGSAAGQSVPHVHVHILPRRLGKTYYCI
jgi:bis(5'-adenosyl)-triphosphatase